MAWYDYVCKQCNKVTELKRLMAECSEPIECPSCGGAAELKSVPEKPPAMVCRNDSKMASAHNEQQCTMPHFPIPGRGRINVAYSAGVTVRDSDLRGSGDVGIHLTNSRDCTITDNTIDKNFKTPILDEGKGRNDLRGNVII